VIDPLFMDELKAEFNEIRQIAVERTRKTKLKAFQKKIAGLKFLDPACGSGNFLTETYISLRRLENAILNELQGGQIVLGEAINPIQVSISQFYGIEINDFAVTVAKTALWIAESQMMKETEDIVHMSLDFLPLKSYANITESNALRIDWESIIPKNELNYIMGNPPFVGYSLQTKEQKADIQSIYKDEKGKVYKTAGKVDYVACWYFKAAKYIMNTMIKTAFVSTNSITQGEQVEAVWKPIYERFGIHIEFTHRTFRWDSEASLKAHVHCVIIGFNNVTNNSKKKIYQENNILTVDSINPYLLAGDTVFIESRKKPICTVPQIVKGSSPVDGGNLLLSESERYELLSKNPSAEKFIRRFYGAKEYLHNIPRYCLWLEGILPEELNKLSCVKERVIAVKKFRNESTKEATRKYADYPLRFMEIRQPDTDYILIPRHSSENRRYIPMGFLSSDQICGDANIMMPNATLYHFGVLMSNVHMAWVRAVCGRIKSDYRYS
ncbi:MAG: N-6 DNA methylase, partial [Lachnospiraceae bacterium]|nr:N-6 DNA methylase [Lachnospiraceae bacterium]